MSEWKEKRFGDLVSFPPKVKLIKGKEYPFILMEEIEPRTKFVNTNISKPYNGSGSKFENGDTLFARITPSLENGKIAQARGLNNPGFGSTELYVFRAKKDISDKDFIYYLCRADFFIQNAVNSYVGASGRQRADSKFIANTTLRVPNFKEQQRIASILSAYDELIENNNRRIALLEQMAEQIYKEWFVRMRFPGYEKVEFEKGMPKGWKWKKVEETFKTSSGGTPSRQKEQEYFGGNIDWIKTGELKDSYIFDSEEKITEAGLQNSSAKLFPPDSLLMAMYGVNIGKLGISVKPSTSNQAVCVFSPKSHKEYSLYYSYFYFKSIRSHLFNISMGAAQQNLSQEIIKRLNFLTPEKNLLSNFNKIQKPLFELILKLSQQNQNLKQTRDLLLPRLISGKLKVKEAEK